MFRAHNFYKLIKNKTHRWHCRDNIWGLLANSATQLRSRSDPSELWTSEANPIPTSAPPAQPASLLHRPSLPTSMRSPGPRLPAPAQFVVAALFLAALTGGAVGADGYGRTRRLHMKNKVLEMWVLSCHVLHPLPSSPFAIFLLTDLVVGARWCIQSTWCCKHEA